MGGVVLRCTAKMLSLLGTRPRDLETIEPSDQDWYANLLWLEARCLLLAHAATLFSVFVPDIRKADSSQSSWPADPAPSHSFGSSIDLARICVLLTPLLWALLRSEPSFAARPGRCF